MTLLTIFGIVAGWGLVINLAAIRWILWLERNAS